MMIEETSCILFTYKSIEDAKRDLNALLNKFNEEKSNKVKDRLKRIALGECKTKKIGTSIVIEMYWLILEFPEKSLSAIDDWVCTIHLKSSDIYGGKSRVAQFRENTMVLNDYFVERGILVKPRRVEIEWT